MLPFFPNAVFAWVFVVGLTALLAAAAREDIRRLVVPKAITLTMLAAGVVVSVARGAWNGALGRKTWLFDDPTALVGGIDGLLFAGAGFLVGFGVFFAFWILGIAGGGDVKVVAALGSWLGPFQVLGALLFSFPVVVVLTAGGLIFGTAKAVGPAPGGTKPRRRLMSYTFPLAVATLAYLLLVFRYDLGLMTPPGSS